MVGTKLTHYPGTCPANIYTYIRLSFKEVCPLVSRKVKLCNTHSTLLGRCFRYVLQNIILVVLQDATLQLFLILCHTPGTTGNSIHYLTTQTMLHIILKLYLYVPLGCVNATYFVTLFTCIIFVYVLRSKIENAH